MSDEHKYIVNPGGAVHSVTHEHFAELIAEKDWREAEAEEVAAWYDKQGLKADGSPKAKGR